MRPILHDLPSRVEMPLTFDCFSEGFEMHVRRAGGDDEHVVVRNDRVGDLGEFAEGIGGPQ